MRNKRHDTLHIYITLYNMCNVKHTYFPVNTHSPAPLVLGGVPCHYLHPLALPLLGSASDILQGTSDQVQKRDRDDKIWGIGMTRSTNGKEAVKCWSRTTYQKQLVLVQTVSISYRAATSTCALTCKVALPKWTAKCCDKSNSHTRFQI